MKLPISDGVDLWIDGDISVSPEHLPELLVSLGAKGLLSRLKVTLITQEVQDYNRFAETPLTTKSEVDVSKFPPSWLLPDSYKYMDLDEYLLRLADRVAKDPLYEQRLTRLAEEIALFKSRRLDDVLRTLAYVIDTMKANKVVWGVGRGSSCSSYLLYLMGLHEVDVVKYEIEITDFIR